MATLIFQSYQGVSQDEEGKLKLDDMILEQLERLATSSRYWTIFRVGKQATRQVFKSFCMDGALRTISAIPVIVQKF